MAIPGFGCGGGGLVVCWLDCGGGRGSGVMALTDFCGTGAAIAGVGAVGGQWGARI